VLCLLLPCWCRLLPEEAAGLPAAGPGPDLAGGAALSLCPNACWLPPSCCLASLLGSGELIPWLRPPGGAGGWPLGLSGGHIAVDPSALTRVYAMGRLAPMIRPACQQIGSASGLRPLPCERISVTADGTVSWRSPPCAGGVLALLAALGPGGDRHQQKQPGCCGVSLPLACFWPPLPPPGQLVACLAGPCSDGRMRASWRPARPFCRRRLCGQVSVGWSAARFKCPRRPCRLEQVPGIEE